MSASVKPAEDELPDVVATGWGLIYTPLCAIKSLSLEDAARIYTEKNPPGTIANRWVPTDLEDSESVKENFFEKVPEGVAHEYPLQCPDYEGRHHFLVNC